MRFNIRVEAQSGAVMFGGGLELALLGQIQAPVVMSNPASGPRFRRRSAHKPPRSNTAAAGYRDCHHTAALMFQRAYMNARFVGQRSLPK
jgi:hypothetical protein